MEQDHLASSTDNFIVGAPLPEVERFMQALSFRDHIETQREQVLYEGVKRALIESLSEKHKKHIVLVSLAERIARTTIILDRLDRKMMRKDIDVEHAFLKESGKNFYIRLSEEHRRCCETFADIRFSEDKGRATKALDTLRDLINEKQEDLDKREKNKQIIDLRKINEPDKT